MKNGKDSVNAELTDRIRTLSEILSSPSLHRVTFFGGAGVSTESGIPDFRSVDGLYHQTYAYPPETILSASFFHAKPEEFFAFYRDKMLFDPDVIKPNAAHLSLARLEKMGKMQRCAIVTQNIDGLHTAAGSENVYELHGSMHRNYCTRCHKFYPMSYIASTRGIPRCECGGIVKPDVVLYEEQLDEDVIDGAVNAIANADVLIIGGTSLTVYPAAGLIRYFRGNRLVIINRDATSGDKLADLVIHGSIGTVLSAAVNNPT